jgi:serine/threonine-protein kinase
MGKFELLKVIGKGGIATIYKAKDLNRNKTIALKVMDCILLKDADLVYKFFCEGEAITTINEKFPDAPVVKVFEYGRDREKSLGVPYIAMELIKGSNLLDIMKNDHFLTVKRKLYIIKQVAMALIAAHRLKIYHGDITPDNIIVNEDKVTLIDFGISVREHDTYKNMDASITGKPVYMSPEQCTGHPVDDKSDIYSLGIILYFMCSGTPPFIHRNSTEIMKMHPEKPVPEIKEPIPEELKDFIKKMLAKKKGTRPDAREVVNKMESFMNQMQEQELPIQELKKEGSKFQRFYEKMNNKISWVNKRQNILINLKKISRDAWRRIMK